MRRPPGTGSIEPARGGGFWPRLPNRERRLVRRLLVNPLAQVLALVEGDGANWNFIRACGDIDCDACGEPYWTHAADPLAPFLVIACDGRRLKL